MSTSPPVGHKAIKLHPRDLRLGMYVCALDRPWLDSPFLFQGFILSTEQELQTLHELCDFVLIDPERSPQLQITAERLAQSDSSDKIHYPVEVEIEEEIAKATVLYSSALEDIHQALATVAGGDALSATAVMATVKGCLESVMRNPSALMWLTRIKHVDQYTAEHCLNVGIQAMVFARFLGLPVDQIELLGVCGMLHDVGKMSVDQTVLNKPGQLTFDEFEHIKLHSVFGRDALLQDPHLPKQVVTVAYSHHERIDGQGYPLGLPAQEIDQLTRLITVVDAYDAITSRRCYSDSNSSETALKILYQHRNTQFDEALVLRFIECIGVYPPGTLVEMNSGEVGIVLSVDQAYRLQPRVALILDAHKQSMQQRVIDLRAEKSAHPGSAMKIARVLVDGAYGVDLEVFTRENIRLGR